MWIEKSKVDEKFLEYSYQYQKKYPFIWNYIVKKIICNQEISYFRDTTGIIHINLIDYRKLQNFFEILKGYLNIGVIEKVIYKKEFIIIHFTKTFHMEYFTNVSFLLAINLYFFLITKYDNIFKVYYGAILSYNDKRKLIEIVIEYNNTYYLLGAISESRIHNTVIIILLFIKIIQLLLSFLHILLIMTQKTA